MKNPDGFFITFLTMHIQDILTAHRTTFSFEFFPPKTDEAADQLFNTIAELEPLKPSQVARSERQLP